MKTEGSNVSTNQASEYSCLKGFREKHMAYEVSSIKMEDSIHIMRWRNNQITALRQKKPLTEKSQLKYFEETVRPQFSQERPEQVLLRLTYEDKLIGYGGLVHLNWEDARGEVSFLLEPERTKDEKLYQRECKLFMNLLMKCAFLTLNLNKISTEAYAHRKFHVMVLESSGFTREGVLRQQTQIEGEWIDAVVASCLKSEYLENLSNGKE
jgi:RimJ/RimL family protein N-acetyltransferase